MSDAGLLCLGTWFEAMELARMLPPQWRSLRVPLIPKKDGFRAIGLFPSPMRLWARSRRDMCDVWERTHAMPQFAATAGCEPLSPVWRAAVLDETAVGEGGRRGQRVPRCRGVLRQPLP